MNIGEIEEGAMVLRAKIDMASPNMHFRVSDSTAFFYMGEMVEFGDTKKIFTNPDKVETQNYITGRFG